MDRSGDRVRVTAQLVDTQQGHVLWSARFDEAAADVFALQDEFTTQIAGTLAIHVRRIEQRRAFAKPTESLAAYDDVLRARPALQHPTRLGVVEARRLLEHAIDLDPNYADAYSALGESYYVSTSMGWAESPIPFLKRAEALSNTATEAQRFPGARARYTWPYRYVLSQIRRGSSGDRPGGRHKSE